jgi:hypothetical protein
VAFREGPEDALLRWQKLELVQTEYAAFGVFLDEAMLHLGFKTSAVQHDIASFLEHGPQYLMIQAQRGQAKTTITAIYAVWCLIHNPQFRVLIVSAGGKQANEISTLIVRLLLTMEELEPMRPDATNGDRTSVEAFDIHYTLKGIDKSPSVACIGITGNLQGKRADLLIPDDIESQKNARTATMRELLLELTRDFTSICETGRILYLGTPQTQDSVYNTLPGRGYTIRIWPGRYPNAAQMANYGNMLAPYIKGKLIRDPALAYGGGMLGDQGQAVDDRLTEEVLQKKELDQGKAYFQLQHMLDTTLNDQMRFPLKLENLVVMRCGGEYFPMTVARSFGQAGLKPYSVHNTNFHLSTALPRAENDNDVAKLQGIVMYVDPAGGGKNGDETGYAVTGFLNGNIYLLACGGIPGGYGIAQMERLADIALRWRINTAIIEKNMGYGAFAAVWLPILHAKWKCAVIDDLVHGQKELRIIETLEPVMARGSLIINEDVIDEDRDTASIHDPSKRNLFSLFHQLSKITRDRNCLFHDDRADAVEGAVRYWVQMLAIDQSHAVEAARKREWMEKMKDPLGKKLGKPPSRGGGSLFNKYLRR